MPSVVAEVGSTANNYQVLAKLATGGMAEIFLARGASVAGVERYVVLKRILRDRATDSHFVQMFLQEARLAAQLNHPNVAQVFDIGKLGESYFFTMEYVHGETVRALLHRARSLRREIPLGVILTVIAGTAAGLHHAHARLGLDGRPLGIVHRDVSPSNLMVSYEGSVKVVDFGVAKADHAGQQTRSGAVKGKISYLSPEQCRGAPVDRRSDLFSLGIVLWEMLTTERLYRRESDFANMDAIVNEPPPAPSTRRANVPAELDQLALRLLSKHGDERFASADELVDAIEELAARHAIVLSASALSRFLRELFGQRPEPWHEVQEAPEGVTVTSESIPPELASALDPIDHQLAHVRDLSAQRATIDADSSGQSESQPSEARSWPPQSPQLTAPAMSAAQPLDPYATVDLRTPRPMPYAPHHGTGSGAMIPGGVVPTMPTPAMPTPAMPAPAMPAPAMPAPVAAKRPPWPLVFVIGGAAIAGVVVAIAVSSSSSGPSSSPGPEIVADPAGAPADAAGAVAVATAPPDAPGIADAGEGTSSPPDAPPIADPPPIADAPPPSRSEQIATAFAQRRFDDVVEACADGLRDRAAECTAAACERKQPAQARAWLARVAPARRASVLTQCKAAGLDLEPRPVTRPPPVKPDAGVRKDECLTNPMACQH